jgi:hypothetical protein
LTTVSYGTSPSVISLIFAEFSQIPVIAILSLIVNPQAGLQAIGNPFFQKELAYLPNAHFVA